MDEPTSALAEPEAQRLFSEIERLVAGGASVLYISHRLDEMTRLARRITVLRDGLHVFTRPATEVGRAELVRAMAGRAEREPSPPGDTKSRATALLVARELGHARARFRGVSFELDAGENLGVAGLEGSGASALVHALFGTAAPLAGEALLFGKPYAPGSPAAAFAAGVALVPGDRGESVLPALSVVENASLSSLARYSPRGFVDRARERADAEREGARLSLRAPSFDALAATLSGGNQQKLALLRCLLAKPKVLLLDDPTRGVDIAAKAEIHELLRGLARDGLGVLFRSTELDELVAVAGRVLVLARGRLVATLSGSELTRERLLDAMLGAAA
jgi:ABC-type sugar transport system ATPase subunit